MTDASAPLVVNRLLAQLPARQRNRIQHACTRVELEFGDILCEANQPFRHVYFPLTGFISLLAPMRGHEPLEVGLIGDEGMLGATVTLGIDTAALRAIVQGAGTALRMSVAQLRAELAVNPTLQRILNRYLYVLMSQLSQAATCTHFHDVDARLARWLLMTHDRAHADRFHLTHAILADMMGVRRSSVSVAAAAMQRDELIAYTRGEITVLDRRRLERSACACYAAEKADYARIFGATRRRA